LHGRGAAAARVQVRFRHHIFPTNLMTNSLTKLPYKQMSHIFVLFVSQTFVANQIGLPQTHQGNFASYSLSASFLQKCDGGNAPYVKVVAIQSQYVNRLDLLHSDMDGGGGGFNRC
jgi:hypothetical protein